MKGVQGICTLPKRTNSRAGSRPALLPLPWPGAACKRYVPNHEVQKAYTWGLTHGNLQEPALLLWQPGSTPLTPKRFCVKWNRVTLSTTNTGMQKQAEHMQGKSYRSKYCCSPPFLEVPGCLSMEYLLKLQTQFVGRETVGGRRKEGLYPPQLC